MLRMFVAGSDKFVNRIKETAEEYANIDIAYAAFEPQSTLESFERSGPYHALLLGFDPEENRSLLTAIMRHSVSVVPFVSVRDMANEWDKWTSLKACIVQEGNEMEGVWRHFRNIPLSKPLAEEYIAEETTFRMKSVVSENRKKVVTVPRETVGIYSWKGGVGKSTFLDSLVQSINYLTTARICILDTDTSRDVSDVLMYLGYIPPPENLPGMIAWRSWFKDRRVNEENVLKFLFEVRENIYFMSAISNMADKEAFDEDTNLVPDIFSVLKRYFDLIVVDVGNNLGNAQLLTLDIADHIFLICEPSISEMATLKKFINDTFPVIASHKNKMSFVYNKVINDHRYGQGKCNQKNFAKFTPAQNVGITCIAELPLDMVIMSNVRQKGYTPFFPVDNTAYTREMKKVIEKLYPGGLLSSLQTENRMQAWYRKIKSRFKNSKGEYVDGQSY